MVAQERAEVVPVGQKRRVLDRELDLRERAGDVSEEGRNVRRLAGEVDLRELRERAVPRTVACQADDRLSDIGEVDVVLAGEDTTVPSGRLGRGVTRAGANLGEESLDGAGRRVAQIERDGLE